MNILESIGNTSIVRLRSHPNIVAKLEWAAAGPSELQLRDVAGMVAIAGDTLDLVYLLPWIRVLGLEDAWRRVTQT